MEKQQNMREEKKEGKKERDGWMNPELCDRTRSWPIMKNERERES